MTRENLMLRTVAAAAAVDSPAVARGPAAEGRRPALDAAVGEACGRIPPLWPLRNFVAVNPFLGLADHSFGEACELIRKVGHGDMLMPVAYYRALAAAGRITRDDLAEALERSGETGFDSATAVLAALDALDARGLPGTPEPGPVVLTVADALDRASGSDWSTLVVEEISKWCAAYFDEGQSAWRMPWRSLPLYPAWRQAAALDRSPEIAGIAGFRKRVRELPEHPEQAIASVVDRLGIAEAELADFLHRQLLSIGGWSAHVQYRVRENGRRGQADDSLVHLLAIRLAYDDALFQAKGWPRQAVRRGFGRAGADVPAGGESLKLLGVLQEASDLASQREFRERLKSANAPGAPAEEPTTRAVQAVFCIDVRSEVFRRALESVSPKVETFGFAGFFGFPIRYIPFGHSHGTEQCPVLIQAPFRVRETVAGVPLATTERVLEQRLLAKRLGHVWKSFKNSAVSCFAYVETAGLAHGPKLVTDSFGLTRTVAKPGTEGLSPSAVRRLAPLVHRQRGRLQAGGPVEETGIPFNERVKLARNALRGMGLTGGFSRLVLLCGHGSTTVNNPYGSGLDCGACGGHSGEANARVAAAVLNDVDVRATLAMDGLDVPTHTWFLAGLHDTTTDEVRLFDADRVPESHVMDLVRLRRWLGQASQRARQERAGLLGIAADGPEQVERRVKARSRDWSEVRPEWGLAGNAAFIAAPRERTRNANLAGRAFLHSYDYRADLDGSVLELIMTAPLVVASWINLQYYASTVNNRLFGSGNKTIHNVVGTLGVLEGNGGDLQTGLPWQSLHDGERLVHEPLRLAAFIEAPELMIETVIAGNETVRQLVDNGWVQLVRIGDEGRRYWRYEGAGQWRELN